MTTVNELRATHRCKICGALWRLNPPDAYSGPDGSWSVVTPKIMGKCCDNEPMGDQIEALPGPLSADEQCRELAEALFSFMSVVAADLPSGEHRAGCDIYDQDGQGGCTCDVANVRAAVKHAQFHLKRVEQQESAYTHVRRRLKVLLLQAQQDLDGCINCGPLATDELGDHRDGPPCQECLEIARWQGALRGLVE